MEEYLEKIGKKIVWFQWGEKRYFPNGIKKLDFNPNKNNQEYRTYQKIFLSLDE